MGDKIIIVNDGQTRWGVPHARLLAALAYAGFTEVSPGRWRERPAAAADFPGTGYAALCADCLVRPGYEPQDFPRDTADCGSLTYRPDWDGDWEMEEPA